MRFRCSIVACARWEAAGVAEWLTYHAAIGFDHIYLYCNDDDPAELHAAVRPFLCGPAPFVTFLHFPLQGQQRGMYLHFLQTRLHESEWVLFLDVDEFLLLPLEHDINRFLSRIHGRLDAFYFHWVMFGNNGHVTRSSGGVLESYTRHEDALHPYTKVLVRTETVDLAVVKAAPQHFWHDWPRHPGPLVKLNIFGDRMDDYYDGFPGKALAYVQRPGMADHALANGAICHFCIKSEDDFERRAARGVAGDFFLQGTWKAHKETGAYRDILVRLNAREYLGLQAFWRRLTGAAAIPSVLAPPPGRNLALGRPALQSSVCIWSRQADLGADASGAVSGTLTGRFGFHTDAEAGAWWQVDLGHGTGIGEVRLFNRLDAGQDRARHLTLSVSDDGQAWREVFRKTDDAVFGGVDGLPLVVQVRPAMVGRFLRVALLGWGYLHLDQVEVYGPEEGEASGPSFPASAAAAPHAR